MSKESKRSAIVDLAALGEKVHDARVSSGFSNLDDFSAAILEKTGTNISAKTLYRIEHGETIITLPDFMAIEFTLFDNTPDTWAVGVMRDILNEELYEKAHRRAVKETANSLAEQVIQGFITPQIAEAAIEVLYGEEYPEEIQHLYDMAEEYRKEHF